ncbi:hypothetical protein Tco_1108686 [Tanacetum coccineum]
MESESNKEVVILVALIERKMRCFHDLRFSLVDVVLDGAFGGVGEEEVVVGDGVERFSLSLVKSTNSCFGGPPPLLFRNSTDG